MNLEYLRHGKALCGKVFRRFVETFNFHNDFISNLKGDADLQVIGMGHVKVDRTDERHPVIRCPGCGESKEGSADGNPSPFAFDGTSIVNNVFYWDGVLQELDDFETSATCAVYLTCTQEAPSGDHPDPDWEFEIAEEEAEAPDGGRVVNFKLYDIADHEVTMDYRTTFLELNSPHEKAHQVWKKPASTSVAEAVIDTAREENGAYLSLRSAGAVHTANLAADNSSAYLQLNGPEGKKVLIDPADAVSGTTVRINTLTVTHADGTEDTYDVVSDKPITISDISSSAPDIDVIKEIEYRYNSITSDRGLQARITKVNMKTAQETVGQWTTILPAVEAVAVEDVTWDKDGSKKFVKSTRKLYVVEIEDYTTEVDVFVGTPHTGE